VTPVAYLEGKAELQLGHVPEAIACLERAWDANPNRMYVVNDLGIAYAAGDRFAEAIECFRIVANRYPHRIEPRNNLAGAFMETGRFAEAVAVLEDVPEALRNEAMRENLRAAREQLVAESAAP
jgi:Flp pilus assembly protein TadD